MAHECHFAGPYTLLAAAKWLRSLHALKSSILQPIRHFEGCLAVAKPPFGTRVPFGSPVHSFRSCEMVAKSPCFKILQRTHHEWKSHRHTPILETVGHILNNFQSSFHSYHMSFQILGSQESRASNGVQIGVETKKLWPFEDDCANNELKCRSCTPFYNCWTHFWSTSWISNYAYYISFWILGSQESSALNGAWFGFETKML